MDKKENPRSVRGRTSFVLADNRHVITNPRTLQLALRFKDSGREASEAHRVAAVLYLERVADKAEGRSEPVMNAAYEFRRAIQSANLTPPEHLVPDGKIHRFPTNGKRGDDAGWYVFHDDGIPEAGAFGDWRSGLSRAWRADLARTLTPAEEAAHQRKVDAMRRAREAEEARRHAEAASRAAAIWDASSPAPDDHLYLICKRIQAHELRLYRGSLVVKGMPCDGSLIVPARDGSGAIHTLEFIHPAERGGDNKRFLPGGDYWGRYFSIGATEGAAALCICEGYGTGASIYAATGRPVVVAFNAGNLGPVAQSLRARFPNSRLIVCADDDVGTPGNPGLTKATEAARAVNGLVAVPDFGPDRPEGASDFNDLAVLRGLKAVAECIRRQVFPKDGVTGVTGVQAGCNAGSSRYTTEKSGVTEPGEGHTTPEAEDGDHAAKDLPKLSERPCFRVFDEWVERQTGKLRPGVWFFGVKQGRKAEDPPALTQQWVCSPIHIEAVTQDGQDNNFGRLLRFRNTLGRWREWSMPMELLRGLGDEMRGELLMMGVEIDPLSKALLSQYLQHAHPKRQVRCAQQVGWCGDSFVLPDTAIGPRASDVIFQCRDHEHIAYTQAGTLAEWRSGVAARASGNPLLVQTISASFAGPMLRRCNAEGGGMHFTGDSSIGKTAAIDAACSTWGGDRFRRSWKTTSNGLEGAAALCNDGLLALDEINECDPREVGAIVYALANGYGKQRASRTGSARPVTRWRCFVLSSGERTIATHMAEGGRRAKAGQSVRLLDVPISGKFGAWDDLHGSPNGAAFSEALKQAAATHYGHAGREFLQRLTHDTRDFFEHLERIKALPEFSVEGGEGQDKRAAARFALVALAGEVATEYGITGWEEGIATAAASKGFTAWRSLRGRGNDERRQILESLSGFIERHGDSRFSEGADEDAKAMRVNRAGWWRDEGKDGRVYLFNTDGLREALTGFDFRRALDTLQEAGALPPADASGKRSTPQRIGGRLVRLYTIRADKLEADHGA